MVGAVLVGKSVTIKFSYDSGVKLFSPLIWTVRKDSRRVVTTYEKLTTAYSLLFLGYI